MNYSELTQLVQDYLQTTETSFVGHIPTFVRQAEERINRAVLIPDLRNTTTISTVGSTATINKPSNYLATFSMDVMDGSGNFNLLLLKDYNFLREAYPSSSTEGLPVYYAHTDNSTWTLGPTPDAAYTVTVRYYYDPASIVSSSTSWLGDNAETVLLNATLVEAYTYLKGSADLMEMHREQYTTALNDLVSLGRMIKRDDYREGEIR